MHTPEEDELHRLLAAVVELFEVVLNDVPQLFDVAHLGVVAGVRLAVGEVAEDEAAQLGLGHVTAAAGQVREQRVEVVVQLIVDDVADVREQPGAVLGVHQTVVEHAQRLRTEKRQHLLN